MIRDKRRLKSIEIKGFKSIFYDYPLKIELDDVNVLIGSNGWGKSNIISFFRMLASIMKGVFQKYVAIIGTSQRFLHYGSQITPSISASLRFSNGQDSQTYDLTLAHNQPNGLKISKECIELSNQMETDNPNLKLLGENL